MAPEGRPFAGGGPEGDARGPRVLLVEDDAMIRLDAAEIMAELGCDVTEAGSAPEGRERLARGDFDVLVTDVHLGGELGTDLARAARAARPDLRVVFVTGRDEVEDAAELDARVLHKPFDMARLARALGLRD